MFCFIIFLGLGVMAVSLWLLFDQQLYLQNMGAEQADYFIGTYIILAVGMIMTLVGKKRHRFRSYIVKIKKTYEPKFATVAINFRCFLFLVVGEVIRNSCNSYHQ